MSTSPSPSSKVSSFLKNLTSPSSTSPSSTSPNSTANPNSGPTSTPSLPTPNPSNPHQPSYPSTLVPNSAVSERNITSLLPALTPYLSLPPHSTVLEIASGSGTHLSHYTQSWPDVNWIGSECDDYGVEECRTTLEGKGVEVVRLDVGKEEDWEGLRGTLGERKVEVVLGANFLHMIDFPEGPTAIFANLEKIMNVEGNDCHICFYGPFRSTSGFFSPGDESFDKTIKARPSGSSLGLRNIEDLDALSREYGWYLKEKIQMPVGNFVLVFGRRG